MNDFSLRKRWNSIGFKLTIGVLSVLVPLMAFLIYSNFYASGVVRNQVALSNKNMMSLYMRQVDSSLEDVNTYLYSISGNNSDFQILSSEDDPDRYFFSKISLLKALSEDIIRYKSIDEFFVYNARAEEFIKVTNDNVAYGDQEAMKASIANLIQHTSDRDPSLFSGWNVKQIDNQYYILRILKSGHIYLGAWVKASRLLIPLSLIDLGDNGVSLLATGSGVPMTDMELIQHHNINLNQSLQRYYVSGDKNKYLVVGEKSAMGDFSLIALIPEDSILEKLPYLEKTVTAISLGSVILLPLSLLFLRRTVLNPLKTIIRTMRRVKDGHIDLRIAPQRTSNEFQMVNTIFNDMMVHIHDLKINVYEEQLNKQKIELQHLQLQINPHFFLNSLNIIHSLAQTHKYELIQEMTLCLVRYFRYMFNSNVAFVPLKDELQHIRNYLRIQQLRFPEELTYEIGVSERLLDVPIPSLALQTFVENAIKHAMDMDSPMHLSIRIDRIEYNQSPYIKFIVQDTGGGFSSKVLADIDAGNRIRDEQGEHIGIWNVRRRLQILYAGNAFIHFRNSNHSGAVVEMLLPLKPQS